jgi:SAM-dependent methyltransferase
MNEAPKASTQATSTLMHSQSDLQRIYQQRFDGKLTYRKAVWRALIDDYFQTFVQKSDSVLDLGAGYGEFITQVDCASKYAMDLNPDTATRVGTEVTCFLQDCSTTWPLPDNSLDVVFTSNFFEHLPDKQALGRTLDEIRRCLKPAGRLIAMGPNLKYLFGEYYDFWDHYVPLTENALAEALKNRDFAIEKCIDKFLPFTMAQGPQYPIFFVRLYLQLTLAWRVFGKQFLVVANAHKHG